MALSAIGPDEAGGIHRSPPIGHNPIVCTLLAHLPDSLIGLRDRALLLIGYAPESGVRSSSRSTLKT